MIDMGILARRTVRQPEISHVQCTLYSLAHHDARCMHLQASTRAIELVGIGCECVHSTAVVPSCAHNVLSAHARVSTHAQARISAEQQHLRPPSPPMASAHDLQVSRLMQGVTTHDFPLQEKPTMRLLRLLSAAGYLKDKIVFPRLSIQRVVFF